MATFFKYWFKDTRKAFPLWFWFTTILMIILMVITMLTGLFITIFIVLYVYSAYKNSKTNLNVGNFEKEVNKLKDYNVLNNMQQEIENEWTQQSVYYIPNKIDRMTSKKRTLKHINSLQFDLPGTKIIDLRDGANRYFRKTKIIQKRIDLLLDINYMALNE